MTVTLYFFSIFNFNFMFIACIYYNVSIHLNVHVFLLLFVKLVRLSHFIQELLTYLLNHTLTYRHASLSLDYVVIADCSEH